MCHRLLQLTCFFQLGAGVDDKSLSTPSQVVCGSAHATQLHADSNDHNSCSVIRSKPRRSTSIVLQHSHTDDRSSLPLPLSQNHISHDITGSAFNRVRPRSLIEGPMSRVRTDFFPSQIEAVLSEADKDAADVFICGQEQEGLVTCTEAKTSSLDLGLLESTEIRVPHTASEASSAVFHTICVECKFGQFSRGKRGMRWCREVAKHTAPDFKCTSRAPSVVDTNNYAPKQVSKKPNALNRLGNSSTIARYCRIHQLLIVFTLRV